MSPLKIVYYILLTTSSAAVIINRNRLPSYCRWLMILLPLSLLAQAIEDVISARGIPSSFVFRIFLPMEMALLCAFYYQLFTNGLFKIITLASFFTYAMLLGGYYYTNPERFFDKQFFDFCIEAVLLCLLIVLFFIQMLQFREKINLRIYTGFWMNAIHLIFYGGCLFMMGFYYFLEKIDRVLAGEVNQINYYLNLLLYASYTVIFICTKAVKK